MRLKPYNIGSCWKCLRILSFHVVLLFSKSGHIWVSFIAFCNFLKIPSVFKELNNLLNAWSRVDNKNRVHLLWEDFVFFCVRHKPNNQTLKSVAVMKAAVLSSSSRDPHSLVPISAPPSWPPMRTDQVTETLSLAIPRCLRCHSPWTLRCALAISFFWWPRSWGGPVGCAGVSTTFILFKWARRLYSVQFWGSVGGLYNATFE
jgi:hypothetical protein